MNMIRCLIVVFCLVTAHVSSEECNCNQIPSVEIINDEQLANGIQSVRDDFLARQPSDKFTRLSATILVREKDTRTWKRGSVNGSLIDYPASTVKLIYMYAAMEWCKKQGHSIDCLDRYVRPMVIVSSNLDTGYVIDAITNTTNIDDLTSVDDPRWSAWFDRRLSTERLLKELNMYDNQIVRSKTYPTNSGQSPIGSEAVLLRSPYQRNLLQSCCTASFLLYLMETQPHDELQYMKSMLYRTFTSDQTSFGTGLPAGTILYSKSGNAYDTVEEIAHISLPSGKEIILSAFSNGYQRSAGDFYILGRFAEMVIEKFSLNSSLTSTFTTDNENIYTCTGDVTKHTSSLPKDSIGQSFITFNESCIIHPVLSERGIYTISIWNPSFIDSPTDEMFRLNVTLTDAYTETDRYIYDQQTRFSSWMIVGDYLLNPGRQSVYLTALNRLSAFNAIRFSRHPALTVDPRPTSKSSLFLPYTFLLYILLLLTVLL